MPASQPHDSRSQNYAEDTVVASAAKTSSGNSGVLSGYGSTKSIRAQLDLTAVTAGTTLDVTIEDSLDGTNWNTIGTFTQATTTATRQVINVTTPFADRVRVKWVVVGTSYTFSVIFATEIDPT